MTTPPGSGDQPQTPGQGWGQQPPNGQQPAGQQPAGQQGPGQTPGDQPQQGQWAAPGGQPQQPGQQQFGQPGQQQFGQPGQQSWGAPGQPEQPKQKSALARILPIVGGVLVVIVVGFAVRSFLGGGVPDTGDCTNASVTQLEVVDCDSDEASYRVAGTVDDVSENELSSNPQLCLDDYPNAVAYAVTETDPDEKGTGICLEPVS